MVGLNVDWIIYYLIHVYAYRDKFVSKVNTAIIILYQTRVTKIQTSYLLINASASAGSGQMRSEV
jgi:hypothetical protein